MVFRVEDKNVAPGPQRARSVHLAAILNLNVAKAIRAMDLKGVKGLKKTKNGMYFCPLIRSLS